MSIAAAGRERRGLSSGAMSQAMDGTTGRAARLAGPALVALAFLVWGAAIPAGYVLDGALVVRDNALLSPFEPLRIASLDWWEGTGRPGGLYRPVPLVSLAALRALGDGAPTWINASNVALLGLVAWLRFELLVRLCASLASGRGIAWFAAALALVHPANAELAGGQVGHADLLAMVFTTAALLVGSKAGIASAVVAGLLAALATLSKESGVLVVPFALLFEALRSDEGRSGRVLRALGWSAIGVALALGLRVAVLGSLASVDDPVYAGFGTIERVASALAALAQHTLPLVLWPVAPLSVVGHQDVSPAHGLADPRALLGLATLATLLVGAALALRRGRRELCFGLALFLVAWLPTSNMLISTGAIAASRFVVPGLVGLALALALPLGSRAWGRGALAALLLALGALSWRELWVWATPEALFEAQAARSPKSAYALVDHALLLAERDPAGAQGFYERALATPDVSYPGTQIVIEEVQEARWIATAELARLAEREGDLAAAALWHGSAAARAEQALHDATAKPFVEDWARSRDLSLERLAATEIARSAMLSGDARTASVDAADSALQRCQSGTAESVRLRALVFDRRGESSARSELIEREWRARPDEPLLRILWASELRAKGRASEALDIELDVATKLFGNYDRTRSLAMAREALAHPDARLANRGRALLEQLARGSDSIAAEAVQALRSSPPRRP
jgi:hypothetical protein